MTRTFSLPASDFSIYIGPSRIVFYTSAVEIPALARTRPPRAAPNVVPARSVPYGRCGASYGCPEGESCQLTVRPSDEAWRAFFVTAGTPSHRVWDALSAKRLPPDG